MAEGVSLPTHTTSSQEESDVKRNVQSVSHTVPIYRCSCCKRVVTDTIFLHCGHYICPQCTQQHQLATEKDQLVTCPVGDCTREQNKVEEVLKTTPNQPSDGVEYKAMEDDLLYDPPLDEEPYRNLAWFQEMERRRERARAQGKDIKVDQYTFERFYSTMQKQQYPPPQTVQLPRNASLDDVMDIMCDDILAQEYVIGFYPCHKRNRIVLDVETGCRDKAKNFLTSAFRETPQYKQDELFVITEQNSAPKLTVATGKKVSTLEQSALDPDTIGAFRENTMHRSVSQNELHSSFGTIGCLAKTSHDELYALTAKHCLQYDSRQECQGEEKVVSVVEGNLRVIGDEHIGYEGAVKINGRNNLVKITSDTSQRQRSEYKNKAVDIAAIPLRKEIVSQLDPHLMHDLKDYFEDINSAYLHDRVVIKNGAESGETSGTIYNTQYRIPNGRVLSGEYILIVPQTLPADNQAQAGNHQAQAQNNAAEANDGAQAAQRQFSREGDSGSLIWDRYGKPIGMLVRNWDGHRIGENNHNSTLAVRLDNNIALLRHCDVDVQKLVAYGAPLPTVEARPEAPHGEIDVDNVVAMNAMDID